MEPSHHRLLHDDINKELAKVQPDTFFLLPVYLGLTFPFLSQSVYGLNSSMSYTSDLLQVPLHVLDCLLMTSDDFLELLMLYLQPVYVHILIILHFCSTYIIALTDDGLPLSSEACFLSRNMQHRY